MITDAWNPALYERFKSERTQPARDLIAMIRVKAGMRVLDLGCGTGEITRELHQSIGAAETLGIDRSRNMLAQAIERAESTLRFVEADIAPFAPDHKVDLVYSNAALQWVDDHATLLERFKEWLNPEGQIAIQVPCGDWHPTHTAAARLAEQYGTGPLYRGGERVLTAPGYAALLFRLGFREQRVLTRVYGHTLESLDQLVLFFSGTLLNPYKAALGAERFERFLADYRAALAAEIGDTRPVFFPMTRTLIWAMA